jgi:hypothetical protein
MEASDEGRIDIVTVRDDGVSGCWVWAVAGQAGTSAAEHALRLARDLADL